jgi:hypothetical protein
VKIKNRSLARVRSREQGGKGLRGHEVTTSPGTISFAFLGAVKDAARTLSKFHDKGDAKWIVTRGKLRGHNDTPFGRPTPGRPIGCPVVGRPQGIFGGLSCYQLVTFFFNIVSLIMELTFNE